MATSTIKKPMKDAIKFGIIDMLVDYNPTELTYVDATANIEVPGYTPISIGYKLNQINLNVYECRLDGNIAHVGIATMDGVHLAHVYLTVYVTYVRNDLISS